MTVTDSYIPFCGIALESMIDNNPNLNICVYIICPDLSTSNKFKMEHVFAKSENTNLIFLSLTPSMQSIIQKTGQALNKTHNTSFILRLLIEDLLPKDINKVLYIDADTIVANNLDELENYSFRNDIGAAVVKDAVRENDYSRLNLDKNKHIYFNSGVMLINLDFWRKHHVGMKCLNMIIENPASSFMPDQDALNIVLEGKVDYLHPRCNCLTLFSMRDEYLKNRVFKEDFNKVKEASSNPTIIHYVFVNKPWFKGGYLPKREIWNKYHKISEWSDVKIKWRNGYKSFIRHYTKQLIEIGGGVLGFDLTQNPFIKRRYPHIRIFFLLLYYCFAQWLPNVDTKFWGKPSNYIRVLCVRKIFDYVGKNVNIGRRAYFGSGYDIRIGNRSNIGPYCNLPSNIHIGEDVIMGPNNFFFGSFTHCINDTSRPMIEQGLIKLNGRTIINDDIWIGLDCIFMPNIEIKSHSVIGARTVVTKNVPEWVIFAGNPGITRKKRK